MKTSIIHQPGLSRRITSADDEGVQCHCGTGDEPESRLGKPLFLI